MSGATCETCGQPGELVGEVVLCGACAEGDAIVIPLPWDRPPLRANDRRSWQAQHRVKAKAIDEARWAIRAARVEPIVGAVVTLHYRVPDRRRRDSDGPEPTKKIAIDALVLEGILPDDSWVEVPRSSVEIHPPTSDGPAMWLELSEITNFQERPA